MLILTALQAGLVANFLTYPWKDTNNNPFDPSDNSKGSMGERMKAALIRWSYQRLPDKELVDKAMSERGWNTWQAAFQVPDRVNVAYNSKWRSPSCNARSPFVADMC